MIRNLKEEEVHRALPRKSTRFFPFVASCEGLMTREVNTFLSGLGKNLLMH